MTQAALMLGARDVVYSWGAEPVLRGFSLDVREGQVVCLMGANGCGKSTFLDCVLGENRPSSGTIEVSGRDAASLRPPERARLVSYVPQIHERTFPYPVEHLVLMGRTAHQNGFGSVDDSDRRLAADALRACGIGHLAERPCTALSGGEMQMVLLARALVQQAPLIILDEPTAHLDFKNELVFLETVERLVADGGTSVLMATHSPNQAFHLEAAGLEVRVALMAHGRVAAFGPPGAVLTPEALREHFGIEACVMEADAGGSLPAGGACRALRQIVPLRTVGSETREGWR